MPTSTWFGGSEGTPMALRTSESTMMMRVNEVTITSSARRQREHREQHQQLDTLRRAVSRRC